MKIWNRINNSDRKKVKASKARMILSSFGVSIGLLDKSSLKSRKYMTVIKL